MSKDLRLSYILFFIFSSILVSWNTLSKFFGGVALNFIALLAIVFVIILIYYKDKNIFKRTRDLFWVSSAFVLLELITYFSNELGNGESIKGFIVYQNILSILGMVLMIYIGFRFALELLNKRVKFIEVILGNEKFNHKIKKTKEISNGSLEDKPNNKVEVEENETIIIETEE